MEEQIEIARLAMLGVEAGKRRASSQSPRWLQPGQCDQHMLLESLPGGIGKSLPAAEEPDPEVSAAAEVANDEREQCADLGERGKGEDIVGLGLPHELAEVVGPDLVIGIGEA